MKILEEPFEYTTYLMKKGYSINTTKSYLNDIKYLYEWLEISNKSYDNLQKKDIPKLISYLDSQNSKKRVSPSTLNRFLAAISSYYSYLEIVGLSNTNFSGYSSPSIGNSNKSLLGHVNSTIKKSAFSYV